MHSTWQMALLLLFYYVAVNIFRQWPPLAKRNLLLFLLSAQVISSFISFYFIYSSPFLDYREDIQALLQSFSSSQGWLLQYAPLLFGLYAFGLLYKLSYAWFNWKKFNRLYKSSLLKPSVDIRLFTEAKAIHFGISKKVKIWCSHHIQSPVTFGYFKPVILLPVALISRLNIQQTESLIVHELTHIKNNDYLINWFMLATDAIFFFNPFVKITVQKIKREREKSCDVQVLQFNYPAIGYAEALLHIARQQSSKAVLAPVAAVSKKTELLDRIRYFSDDKNITRQQTKHFSFAALLVWSFIILNVFFAGIFVTASKPSGSNNFNNIFAAGPLNEWNKSFSTEASVEPEAGLLPATTLAVAPVEEKAIAAEEHPSPEPVTTKRPETLFLETVPALELTPVSFTEAHPEVVKEVTINEETNGVMVTKVFRMTSINGEVKMEPLWMISETRTSDSLKLVLKKDSSVITVIPTVQ